MKKILIVSYHFPPDASVGGMKPAKFAKYLPQFGWEPIILTVKERYHPMTDQSKQIPTKLYDYIAVRKPILVCAEDGATADLAGRLPHATVVGPQDQERLEAKLKQMYAEFQRGVLVVKESATDWIHRELTKVEATRKLAHLLN